MKVKDLAAMMADWPQDAEVWLAIDAEGNGFRKMDNYSNELIESGPDPERWTPDVLCPPDCTGKKHPQEECEKAPPTAVPAVIIWTT